MIKVFLIKIIVIQILLFVLEDFLRKVRRLIAIKIDVIEFRHCNQNTQKQFSYKFEFNLRIAVYPFVP